MLEENHGTQAELTGLHVWLLDGWMDGWMDGCSQLVPCGNHVRNGFSNNASKTEFHDEKVTSGASPSLLSLDGSCDGEWVGES